MRYEHNANVNSCKIRKWNYKGKNYERGCWRVETLGLWTGMACMFLRANDLGLSKKIVILFIQKVVSRVNSFKKDGTIYFKGAVKKFCN